jgi:Spy/CpxP family protein refolding chaperone
MKKTIKIIFTLSLLLNIALIGVVLGGMYKRYKWHQPPVELSEKSQKILKDNFQQTRMEMRESFDKIRADGRELQHIITAETFDREAYDEAVSKILKKKDDLAHAKADSMGDVLSRLSVEERQKISKRLVRGLAQAGKHFKDKDRAKRFSDRLPDRQE